VTPPPRTVFEPTQHETQQAADEYDEQVRRRGNGVRGFRSLRLLSGSQAVYLYYTMPSQIRLCSKRSGIYCSVRNCSGENLNKNYDLSRFSFQLLVPRFGESVFIRCDSSQGANQIGIDSVL